MRVVCISDTHEQERKINVPDGDLLIHCGDWTNRGDSLAMEKFLDWFSGQPHIHKVFIAGNHELTLDYGARTRLAALEMIKEYTDKNSNLHYLESSGVNIEGFNCWGAPYSPLYFHWAFNLQRGKDIAIEWAKIPPSTNVLISHGPPYLILDMVQDTPSNRGRDLHQGCEELAKRVKELKELKLHCFGHLHTDGGKSVKLDEVQYVNAACCTESYKPTNQPVVIEI